MTQAKFPFINRELSWLSFNQRVLQEAADPDVPLLERLKFLGICSSNLDEFYKVRVATYTRMMHAGIKKSFEESPKKILNQIQKAVLNLRDQFESTFSNVLEELKKENIFMINETQLNHEQQAFLKDYFEEKVRPRLVPIMLSPKIKFPYLENQVIYLAVHLSKSDNPEQFAYSLIELPEKPVPRFITLPNEDKKKYIIMIDDVIRFALADIFSMLAYDQFKAYTVKLTRDAEFDISDDITKSFYEKISKSIKERDKGQIVRFVYDNKMPEDLLNFILTANKIEDKENVIPGGRYHNARDFMRFPTLGLKHLVNAKQQALRHPDLKPKTSIFEIIKKQDILLHYPYHSYNHVLDFLREAAIDPKVKSIKITLYRLAANSSVINSLINAMRNGKSVTVVIELQARFDEEANIYWTNQLAEEGARILDGVPGLKVHAKLCQVLRKEETKDVLYTYISTGNFNETTAKMYCDHGLFTAHKEISKEVKKVFDFLQDNYKTYAYKHILVSPFFMRNRFKKFIKNEIKAAKLDKEAFIYVKLNSLVDQDLIKKLYQASQAGVKIRLIIRGICSLVPGIPGISDNIKVYSIIDKYLEHSRIFIFGNEGNPKYFLSSADWMIRNLDNRIEVATPIYDKNIQNELKDYFSIQLKDTLKARVINKKQDNLYREKEGKAVLRSQVALYDYLKNKHVD